MGTIRQDAINTYEAVPDKIPAGMLSSPHIRYCVEKFKIIGSFEEKCLSSATYHMRLGSKALTWENGKKTEYNLADKINKNKDITNELVLKPNSLTLVTTIETFNLPKDIIARFNLKSSWVHKGILLGTGPIVDPELQANLLIPLHNFSNSNISIKYGEKLISVEFTKTLNPNDTFYIKANDIAKYKPNEHWKFDFESYWKRIGQSTVESSVSFTLSEMSDTLKKANDRVKFFSIAAIIGSIGVFIALITLVFTTWMVIDDANQQVKNAEKIIQDTHLENFEEKNLALNNDLRNFKALYKKTMNDNIELTRRVTELEKKITFIVTNTTNNKVKTNSLEQNLRCNTNNNNDVK